MKNTYKIALAIMALAIIVIGGMSMKNAVTMETPPPCWSTITVGWTGNCVYPDPNAVYVVNVQIIDECNTPNSTVYNSTQTEATTEVDVDFCVTDTICDPDHSNQCWHVIASVAKINVSDHSIICSGQTDNYYTCDEMNSSVSLSVPLN